MVIINSLHKMVEKGSFSISFVAESGEIVHAANAICTSWHSRGRTMNIKILPSGQIRTVRRCSVINFNGEEVAL